MSRARSASYAEVVNTLEAELDVVARGFEQLTAEQWATVTRLETADPSNVAWTLFELAGHLDISIGITQMLIDETAPADAVPERDAVDFFIFPSVDVAADFYEYAFTMVEDQTPATMAAALRSTFADTIARARHTDPGTVGAFPGFEPHPLIRLDDFVSTRVVEAVIHGIDLTDALGNSPTPTREGIALTAQLLDQLLVRRNGGARPPDLDDDTAWIRAASGRTPHPDPRLPLLS